MLKSVTPGQMVVKLVNDELVAMLGTDAEVISLNAPAPVPILMVGLQGSGKTTTTAKIARRLSERERRKVLLASLDTRRPAAMEQLAVLAKQVGVESLPIVAGQSAVQIARRAMEAARLGGFDVVMLDTAGRTTVDEALMVEAADVKAATNPHEVLLVADALTGQDAVNTARAFDERLGVTGIVLTRMDGDSRGGAALSMRAVTGKPIKLVGTGEKVDALEEFHPARVANRILGMGDIVSLVEKAAETIDHEQALRTAEKMRKGKFDLEDLSMQLAQMERMGGIGGLMGMLPGMGQIKKQVEGANLDEKMFKRQRAIISSMTPQERKNPDLLKNSRKKRIAAGRGRRLGDQQAPEDAPDHGRHDEGDGLGQARHRPGAGLDVRARRRRRDAGGHARPAAGDAGADAGADRRPGEAVRGQAAADAAGLGAAVECRSCRACRASGAEAPRPRRPAVREEEMTILSAQGVDPELARLRDSIDNFDAALIHLLAERFRCTQRVGELKARKGIPPSDPDREARQVARLRTLAVDAKLDPDFAEKFLAFVVKEVIRHHQTIAAEHGATVDNQN